MELNADFRSDTLTRPTPAMLDAMHAARTGDDVFAEDPTTEVFQQRCADMFGHEAALFCPSGTMTNQIAINVHVRPGDEVICDRMAHIYNYEGGGIARNSGASVRLLHGDHGRFSWEDAAAEINPADSHYARTSLVCIEDTCNRGGGAVWDVKDIQAIREGCDAAGMPSGVPSETLTTGLPLSGGPEAGGELLSVSASWLDRSARPSSRGAGLRPRTASQLVFG